MREITLQELLEAGCHFGHQVNRRNPAAQEYIFEARAGVHIINLEKTHEGLMEAAQYIKDLSARGGSIILIGNKRQAQGIIKEEYERAVKADASNIYFVASRWIGGTFTNFGEVSKNFKRLNELNALLASNDRSGYTKREFVLFDRERAKLRGFYEGIANMTQIPDAVFIVDTHLEKTAVDEALKLGVKIVGITDTNADPAQVNYPIPANDDAVGSVKIITEYLVDAWIEGAKERGKESAEAKAEPTDKKVDSTKSSEPKKEKEVKTEEKKEVKKTEKKEEKPKVEKPKKAAKTTKK